MKEVEGAASEVQVYDLICNVKITNLTIRFGKINCKGEMK